MFYGRPSDPDLTRLLLTTSRIIGRDNRPDTMPLIIIPSEITGHEGPHPRAHCSPERCPFCNFSKLVCSTGDVTETLRRIVAVQKNVEMYHDKVHELVKQSYRLRWFLKSHPQPAQQLLILSADLGWVVRAGDHAAVEEIVRAALRNALQDHRELEIKRRDLERVVIMI